MATFRDCIDLYHARQAARTLHPTGDTGAGTGDAPFCEAENLVLSSAPVSPDLNFGDMLQIERVNAGLSQNALAYKAGVNASHVNRLERGRADASRRVVLALARALALTPYRRSRLMEAAGYAIRAREAS